MERGNQVENELINQKQHPIEEKITYKDINANQLPSIAPGDVLNDLLKFENIKSTFLNTIYRVKDGSYITTLAYEIKNKSEFTSFDENYSDFKFIESNDLIWVIEFRVKWCSRIGVILNG